MCVSRYVIFLPFFKEKNKNMTGTGCYTEDGALWGGTNSENRTA